MAMVQTQATQVLPTAPNISFKEQPHHYIMHQTTVRITQLPPIPIQVEKHAVWVKMLRTCTRTQIDLMVDSLHRATMEEEEVRQYINMAILICHLFGLPIPHSTTFRIQQTFTTMPRLVLQAHHIMQAHSQMYHKLIYKIMSITCN